MIIYITAAAFYLFIVIYPTMWAAKKCGAENAGFLPCLLATLAAIAITTFLILGIESKFIIAVTSLIAMTVSLKLFLGTKIFQSLIISLMSWGISVCIGFIANLII